MYGHADYLTSPCAVDGCTRKGVADMGADRLLCVPHYMEESTTE